METQEIGTPWEEETPRVVIGVPCSDSASMKVLTAHSIGCMIIRSPGVVIDFLIRQSADIVSNRTHLVRQALEKNATHLLFVDSDMYFPPDTLSRLLAHGREIVGVEYNKREFPLVGVHEAEGEPSRTELYIAKRIGLGVTLIDLSIFTDKERPLGAPSELHPNGNPWFSFGRDSQGAVVIGEDVWFCEVARDAGYDVYIDPLIKVRHIGEYAF